MEARSRAQVGLGEPNGYRLFDVCQNVHEWCSIGTTRDTTRYRRRRIRTGRSTETPGGVARLGLASIILRSRAAPRGAVFLGVSLRGLRIPHRGAS